MGEGRGRVLVSMKALVTAIPLGCWRRKVFWGKKRSYSTNRKITKKFKKSKKKRRVKKEYIYFKNQILPGVAGTASIDE